MKTIWYIIGTLCLISTIVGWLFYDSFENKRILDKQAKTLLHTDSYEIVDYYGNTIRPDITKTENYKTVRLVSPGKDKQLNTLDDIVVEKTDINKSRVIGRWVGKKTKEFAKGIVGGVKENF